MNEMQQSPDTNLQASKVFAMHPSKIQSRFTVVVLLAAIAMLILFDQISKTLALEHSPSVWRFIKHSSDSFGMGYLLHAPDAWSSYVALGAFSIGVAVWMLPIPRTVQTLWTAAVLSNHVEMLARPGTVDFLALRLSSHVYVLNVADVYFLLGLSMLLIWVTRLILDARSAQQPLSLRVS